MNKFTTLGLCALTMLLGSCGGDAAEGGETTNADKTASAAAFLEADAKFKDFWALVEKGGLVDRLAGSEKLTVFVPTTKAFDGNDVIVAASESKESAAAFVKKYIVAGALKMADLEPGKLETLAGTSLEVEGENHDGHAHFHVGGAHMSSEDNVVGNGVVHVMNTLFP